MITVESITTLNGNIYPPDYIYYINTEKFFRLGNDHPCESISEWSARLCYNSGDKFKSNDTFINGLIKSGHMDVFEHAVVTFKILSDLIDIDFDWTDFFEKLLVIQTNNPYVKLIANNLRNSSTIELHISATIRTWHAMLYDINSFNAIYNMFWLMVDDGFTEMDHLLYVLNHIAPHIFSGNIFETGFEYDIHMLHNLPNINVNIKPIETDTGAVVQLLGFTNKIDTLTPDFDNKHLHATFQIDNVSRSFTHQHVRHRLLSHSQASQRYIDHSGFDVVEPLGLNSAQHAVFSRLTKNAKEAYNELRALGVKKEDARSVLPNATSTSIISSAYLDGWRHYIKLRDDKAAQYEIQCVARAIKNQLNELYEMEIING